MVLGKAQRSWVPHQKHKLLAPIILLPIIYKQVCEMGQWHTLTPKEAIERLGSGKSGLSGEEAANRLKQHGRNAIESGKKISVPMLLAEQFASPLVLILIVAAAVSLFFGKGVDGFLILSIVVLNGVFGFVQDYNAERSIEALKRIGGQKALAYRGGVLCEVGAEGLVPGDVIYLHEGAKVPADCRIIESHELSIDESILTGESLPVRKREGKSPPDALLQEMRGMAFMHTTVVAGKCNAIIVATGKSTEVGKIAGQLGAIPEGKTRFQEELGEIGKKISIGVMAIVAIIAATMFFLHNAGPLGIFITAISVAVAAIPEGLPAVVTLSLALATGKMLKKNSLVRRLSVVEELGSVEVICTDKTGTLTENSMTVQEIFFDGKTFEVTGAGREVAGGFLLKGKKIAPEPLRPVLLCGIACNDTIIQGEGAGRKFTGDPTEIALAISALKAGISLQDMERLKDFPFTSERKRMTVVCSAGGKRTAYSKGAPEIIIESCSQILLNGKTVPFTQKEKNRVLEQNREMASRALRVLAFAQKQISEKEFSTGNIAPAEAEGEMVFLGLQGMIDPPRPEVAGALATAREAGIRVIMLTGDNLDTAAAIAKKIGFTGKAMDARELSEMKGADFERAVFGHDVFARVSPEQKLEVLRALKARGLSVAMTGDGVNDAPALKQADVGVAMGIRGSDVAKEASDIVLLDDNFATIVETIKEGRGVFENIRKFVLYLLASNLAEVAIVFTASLAGKLAIAPVQLLWVNLLTDGLPALALGADPPKPDAMKAPPRKKGDGVVNSTTARLLLLMSASMSAVILTLFFLYLPRGIAVAQTVVFTSFVLYEFAKLVVIRRIDGLGMLTNRWLVLSLMGSVVVQLLLLYSPASALFGVVALSLTDWMIVAAGGVIAFAANTVGARLILRRTGA